MYVRMKEEVNEAWRIIQDDEVKEKMKEWISD